MAEKKTQRALLASVKKGEASIAAQANRPSYDTIRAVEWTEQGVKLLDQRGLPHACEYQLVNTAAEIAFAIRHMVVRGAPAIGITAAYGVVLAAQEAYVRAGRVWREAIQPDLKRLRNSRPTAVNLYWALERMQRAFPADDRDPRPRLLAEAQAIHEEDITANRRMGEIGASLIAPLARVLTHCNAGALATGGFGTALGVIRSAYARHTLKAVYVSETRPWLQGARLTAWELVHDGIPATLLADGAAAYLMQRGEIDWVIVGADRIAANGDVANKIGTYSLALAARAHGVRFMVVAPTSTLDRAAESGRSIPIENRPAHELLSLGGKPIAAPGVEAWNPVFDITPAGFIDVIVTERGAVHKPTTVGLTTLLQS